MIECLKRAWYGPDKSARVEVRKMSREMGVFNKLVKVADQIKLEIRRQHFESNDGIYFGYSDYYSDDIVSFNINDLMGDEPYLYLHSQNSENISGIILVVDKNRVEWKFIESQKCRNAILTHLESIVDKHSGLSTSEEIYCKKVHDVLNGVKEPVKEVKVREPITKTMTIVDKFLGHQNLLFVVDEDKNIYTLIYAVGRGNELFNSIKLNVETKFKMHDESMTYIEGIVNAAS